MENAEFFKALEQLWAKTTGTSEIRIALLDGPVDRSHPCFAGADLTIKETLVPGGATPDGPASAHGTHIASIIFGQHKSPVKGIAPSCRGVVLPIFSDGADGSSINCSQTDLARALVQAADGGAHVINISGGQITPSGLAEVFLEDAVKYCEQNNILIVAAAGNEGCDCLHIPAALPSVLVAGSVTASGTPSGLSNWGEAYRGKGILAPGENIVGASLDGGVAQRSGTSFSAPIVSGIAALLLSLQVEEGAPPDPLTVRDIILSTGSPCDSGSNTDCRRFLRGIVDIESARQQLTRLHSNIRRPDMSEIVKESEKSAPGPDRHDQDSIAAAGNNGGNEGAHSGPFDDGIEKPADAGERVPCRETVKNQTAVYAADHPRKTPRCRRENFSAAPPMAAVSPAQAEPDSLVYAMGILGYDFGTDAKRDFLASEMKGSKDPCAGQKTDAVPEDPKAMLAFLKENKECAEELIWTLNLDGSPIYAIQPGGAYASSVYDKLQQFLEYQINYKVDNNPAPEYTRVAVPGKITGNANLKSGQAVPTIHPAPKGMKQLPASASCSQGNDDLLNKTMFRLFYELRNLGLTPPDRAKNAMNVYEIGNVIDQMQKNNKAREIESVGAEKCDVCRPKSDCWDVVLTTFNPQKRLEEAKIVYRITMDVSDAIPVRIGEMQQWASA